VLGLSWVVALSYRRRGGLQLSNLMKSDAFLFGGALVIALPVPAGEESSSAGGAIIISSGCGPSPSAGLSRRYAVTDIMRSRIHAMASNHAKYVTDPCFSRTFINMYVTDRCFFGKYVTI
jgi:hypothetical protein